MTDYKLTEEDRKRLTEFLGECWHELENSKYETRIICTKCGRNIDGRDYKYMKSFTIPDDQHAVFSKLVEVGKWRLFIDVYVFPKYARKESIHSYNGYFIQWLFINPERFCKLASDYLMEEGK